MSTGNNNNSGLGFGSLLLLTFIILKLCEVIDWSWWWVLSPIWIVGIFVFFIVLIGVRIEMKKRKALKEYKENQLANRGTKKSKFAQRLEQMQQQQKND